MTKVTAGICIHPRAWGLGFLLSFGEEAFITFGPITLYAKRVATEMEITLLIPSENIGVWHPDVSESLPVNRG